MAYIYKITNILNNKCYIGKTLGTIENRFKQHCKDYKRQGREQRPLYSAMKKYGIENFKVEKVEQCLDKDAENREKYWIEYYGSFKYGYNATLGGDGKAYIDRELVIKTYEKVQNQSEVARLLNISTDSVHNILVQNNINLKSSEEISKKLNSKSVAMIDLETSNILKVFPSIREAERYLKITYRSHIAKVCNRERRSFKGYGWKYI